MVMDLMQVVLMDYPEALEVTGQKILKALEFMVIGGHLQKIMFRLLGIACYINNQMMSTEVVTGTKVASRLVASGIRTLNLCDAVARWQITSRA